MAADPMVILWVAGLATGFWLLTHKRRKAGLVVIGICVAASLVEMAGVSWWLLGRLEREQREKLGQPLPQADAVVVLGGSIHSLRGSPLGMEFFDSVDRLFVAVELVRQKKVGALILAGGGLDDPGEPGEAECARQWITRWNLVQVPIYVLGRCANTHEEAMRTAEMVRDQKWKKIVLVTSAWHMPRAEAVFRKAGVDIIPLGCDFNVFPPSSTARRSPVPNFLPQSLTLTQLGLWMRETMGLWYYRIRGWA